MHGAIPPLSHTPYDVYRGHLYLSASPQAFVQTDTGCVLITKLKQHIAIITLAERALQFAAQTPTVLQ
jgi:hypothetical protein